MSGKTVQLGPRPHREPAPNADAWVQERTGIEPPAEPMKRLTFDIPESLHRAIKTSCATRGTKMVEEIRVLLDQHFRKDGTP